MLNSSDSDTRANRQERQNSKVVLETTQNSLKLLRSWNHAKYAKYGRVPTITSNMSEHVLPGQIRGCKNHAKYLTFIKAWLTALVHALLVNLIGFRHLSRDSVQACRRASSEIGFFV